MAQSQTALRHQRQGGAVPSAQITVEPCGTTTVAFGWRGRLAARWLYVGAALLLLAYVGSRFVLEVLLHRTVL